MNYNKFIEKVRASLSEKGLDLSIDEDLSIGVMNLISLEEHLFFSAQKTGKQKYLDLLKEVREERKKYLKKILINKEGEYWCISKHLLGSSMRLLEVGTKELGKGNDKEAKRLFASAYRLYSLFWAYNVEGSKKDKINKLNSKEQNEVGAKLDQLVSDLLDCCKE